MKRFITVAILTVMTSIMLVACGKNTSEDDAKDTTVQEDNTDTTTVEPTVEPTEAPVSTDAGEVEETITGITYPYTYVDAAGREVALDKEPVKIAVDYLPLWETLILLDTLPIAASGAENYIATWDAFEGYDLSSVQDMGQKEVNLELLTELEPDIILSQAYDVSQLEIENLEKTSNVAVFGPDTKMDWRLSIRQVAKLVNKEAKGEEVIAEVDKKLQDAKVKLEEQYSGQTVMQISVMGEDNYYCAYRPDLYDDATGLGLNVPEGYTTSTNFEQVSMEAIVEMNPDYIFLNVFDGDEAIYEAMTGNSVWQSLKAVQNNHVYVLDGSGHACSPLATVYTVNFITKALLGE
jgi:iron complex transport system substrate-binding protein